MGDRLSADATSRNWADVLRGVGDPDDDAAGAGWRSRRRGGHVRGLLRSDEGGDASKVMQAVAPDAIFLEGGGRETRAEYETAHLPADIEFERAVAGKRGPLTITHVRQPRGSSR